MYNWYWTKIVNCTACTTWHLSLKSPVATHPFFVQFNSVLVQWDNFAKWIILPGGIKSNICVFMLFKSPWTKNVQLKYRINFSILSGLIFNYGVIRLLRPQGGGMEGSVMELWALCRWLRMVFGYFSESVDVFT